MIRVVFAIVLVLWVVTGAAAVAVWRGYRRGERPRAEVSGVVAGFAACSAGLVAVAAARAA